MEREAGVQVCAVRKHNKKREGNVSCPRNVSLEHCTVNGGGWRPARLVSDSWLRRAGRLSLGSV